MSSSPDPRNPVIRGAVAENATAATFAKNLRPEAPADSAEGIERALEQARTTGYAEGWAQGRRDSAVAAEEAAARARIAELVPAGARVFTGASETLRRSGIDADLNDSGRYESVRKSGYTMDRATQLAEIWRMIATPEVVVASAHAVTETGSVVVASASGSQLPAFAGGSLRAIWVVGAQKVVPDLPTALRRVEEHCLPLESERALAAYGQPSAVNRVLVLNAEPEPRRGTVLLLREAIGF